MSDLVVQHLSLFLYTERNEWFSCAILVFIPLLRGMSDLVVQHLCLFLYTDSFQEWVRCATLVFIPLYWNVVQYYFPLYWEEFIVQHLYSFILRGMSDLVVQYLCLFLYTERNEWFSCATLVFLYSFAYWFLYRNDCCAFLYSLYTERNEWLVLQHYSFILRGMSDLVVQH